jgi:hypothetical protein
MNVGIILTLYFKITFSMDISWDYELPSINRLLC